MRIDRRAALYLAVGVALAVCAVLIALAAPSGTPPQPEPKPPAGEVTMTATAHDSLCPEQSGLPVNISVEYGGAPACDSVSQAPAGVIVVCLHTIPCDRSVSGGKECYAGRTDYTYTCHNFDVSPRCPINSGVTWLLGPDQLGAQFFADVVKHEIGRAVDLGDSPDPRSVMYPIASGHGVILPSDLA